MDVLPFSEPSDEDLERERDEEIDREELLDEERLRKGLGKQDKHREEVRMAISQLCAMSPLTPKREMQLAREMREGPEEIAHRAREKMILANQRLIVTLAKRYRDLGMDFLDLVSEGNLGLQHAIDKFNPERGCKLSTYATYWIRQNMTRALTNQSRTIRLSENTIQELSRLRKVEQEYKMKHGKKPSVAKLMKELHITEERMRELRGIRRMWSLDQPNSPGEEGKGKVLGDLVAAPRAESNDRGIDRHSMREQILEALHTAVGITDHERELYLLYSGLGDGVTRTFEEVAVIVDRPNERVKQGIGKVHRALKRTNLQQLIA